MEANKRDGRVIYATGEIEVRNFPRDPDAHSVWVGQDYLLFQHGCLEQFALRTPPEQMQAHLANYNPSIPSILEQHRISPEGFALVLARARVRELEHQLAAGHL
ncbi:hypothetical protein FJZ17_00640 [Candidatus Pacearchaeota archaeon]|nr:hypothetical protein [Candidatus Pacearchaeota archaeon]